MKSEVAAMEEKEFRQFQAEVIDRLARIETKLENGGRASPWQSALVEVVKVLVAALLAIIGVKATGGGS